MRANREEEEEEEEGLVLTLWPVRPLQAGHPLLLVLLAMVACHSWDSPLPAPCCRIVC